MQPPFACGVALCGNAAAPGLHFHRTLRALDFHVARACADFHVTCRGLFEFYTAATTGSRKSAGYADGANAAAASSGARCAVNSVEFNFSRSRARMCFTANIAEPHTAGTAAGVCWARDTADDLVARSGFGMQLCLHRHDEFIADGNIVLRIVIFNVAHADGVAVLLDRRIRFDFVDALFGISAEPTVIGVDAAVNLHLTGISGPHSDLAGAGLDVQIYCARHRESAVEMTIVVGQRGPGGHGDGQAQKERQQYGKSTRTNSHFPSS